MTKMNHMSIEEIVKAVSGIYRGPEALMKEEITGVETDSRKIQEGNLFIPLKGERVDGHQYIPDVMKKGALVTFTEQPALPELPSIQVVSCHQALKELAAYYRQTLDCKIVGITGSVGKTSTKEMIASVLSVKYKVQKTMGNFNNEIGLPLTILSIRPEHQVAVVEMGISDFGEMTRLASIARPDICVITNIGYCHLEFLKDRDGILKAKTEALDFVEPDGCVILNGDDDKLSTVKRGDHPVYFYGIQNSHAFASASNLVNHGLEGMEADLILDGKQRSISIPIPGEHNVYNALAAACVGSKLDLSLEEIAQGIAGVETIKGRNHIQVVNELRIIDDCYNANPVSMKASLEVLSNVEGRRIAVLGDMGELGETEKELHYQVGEYGANLPIRAFFCTGTLSGQIYQALTDYHSKADLYYFQEKNEMTKALKEYVKKGDTILVKASHFMQFETVVAALEA